MSRIAVMMTNAQSIVTHYSPAICLADFDNAAPFPCADFLNLLCPFYHTTSHPSVTPSRPFRSHSSCAYHASARTRVGMTSLSSRVGRASRLCLASYASYCTPKTAGVVKKSFLFPLWKRIIWPITHFTSYEQNRTQRSHALALLV